MFKRTFFVQNITLDNYYGEDLCACAYLIAKTDSIGLIDRCLYTHIDRSGNLTSDSNRVLEIVDSLYGVVNLFETNHMLKEYQDVLIYRSYQQYNLYLYGLKYRFDSALHAKLISKFILFFQSVFYDKINITQISEIEATRRYIKIGAPLLSQYNYRGYCGSWINMEQYMIEPDFIHLENERNPRMTDYFLCFAREFDAVKYGTMKTDLWMERWKKQCDVFTENLKQSSYTGNIIIIKHPFEKDEFKTLQNWCIEQFAGRYKEVMICDEITTRITLLKAISDQRFSCSRFDGVEQAWIVTPEEKYFRGEYFRAGINLNMINSMLKIKNSKRRFAEFFESKHMNSIAIYGMGYLGERFAELLMEEGFDVKFGIDKRGENHPMLRIIRPDDDVEIVDAIIVTPIHLFHEIKIALENKVLCSIISLEEVVEYFLY